MLFQDQRLGISEQRLPDSWTTISQHLPPQWIEDALSTTGVATVRKGRLPMEQVTWLALGIALMQARPRLGASPLKWLVETREDPSDSTVE